MSFFSNIFNPPNPADAAMPYLEQIPGEVHQNLDPYAGAGAGALDQLQPQYDQLINDPTGFVNALMASYQPSQGYQQREDRLTGAAANTAAAGGFSGTDTDIYNQSNIINELMGADQQQYLQNLLGVYNTGLTGENSLLNTGFNAANNISGDISNTLGTEAQLQFQGTREQNQRSQDLFKSLTGMAGSLLGASLPGKSAGSIGGAIAKTAMGLFL